MPDMSIDIFKVGTEAGTHFPGQSKAPEAVIESAGLQQKLEERGIVVRVHDVLATDEAREISKWRPAPKHNGVRNEENSVKVMRVARDEIMARLDRTESFPIVIGGDCSITPAVLSGFWATRPSGSKIGLLYMDGDADLTLPSQTDAEGSSGILDSMNLTHLTGREGGLSSMREFTRPDGKSSLIDPENVVLFGFDPLQPATEHWVYLLENGFKAFTRPTVQRDSHRCMREALGWLSDRVDVIYLHFDVDVIDCGEFPLANYPHYAGVDVGKILSVFEEALACEKVGGLTVTEINPNNDPDGLMVSQVVDSIASGIKRRIVGSK